MKPSLLAVTSELPWPLNAGGRLRTYHLMRELAHEFEVRLVAGVTGHRPDDVAAVERAGITVRAVSLPERTVAGESGRFLSALLAREPYVLYRRHDRREIRRTLEREVAAARPDVLYLDHLDSFQFADAAPGSLVALDMHNIYALLLRREAGNALNNWATRQFLGVQAAWLSRVEHEAVEQADVVFGVSEEECAYFAEIHGGPVHLVPNGVDTGRVSALPAGRLAAPPTLLFIGSLSWRPNVKSVHFLAEDVLPAVRRQVPDARLAIVGRDPGPEVLTLARDGVVSVTPNAADILPFLRDAAVQAVPLEAGGGTRLKILESFAAGLPVVSTAVGCEGIAAADGCELTVAELPQFADAVTRVLVDRARGAALAERARRLVCERYDWRVVGASARRALSARLRQPASAAAPLTPELLASVQ